MMQADKPYLKDWPWTAERYQTEMEGGTLMAWRVVATVTADDGIATSYVVADNLDAPTAELIAAAN